MPAHADKGLLVDAFPRDLLAVGSQLQEIDSLMVQPLALCDVPQRVAHDAPRHARAEIVAVVESVHGIHHVFLAQAGILQVRQLVAAGVGDRLTGKKTFAHALIVKLGSGIGVGHGDLDRLAIEFLGVINRLLDGFFGLARKADDEVAVNVNPDLLAVLHEVRGPSRPWRPS